MVLLVICFHLDCFFNISVFSVLYQFFSFANPLFLSVHIIFYALLNNSVHALWQHCTKNFVFISARHQTALFLHSRCLVADVATAKSWCVDALFFRHQVAPLSLTAAKPLSRRERRFVRKQNLFLLRNVRQVRAARQRLEIQPTSTDAGLASQQQTHSPPAGQSAPRNYSETTVIVKVSATIAVYAASSAAV